MKTTRPARPHPALRPRRRLAFVAAVLAGLFVSGAFAQGATSSSQCHKLQNTRYWNVAYQIAPMPSPEPNNTQHATDGFTVRTYKGSGSGVIVDIERTGMSDNEKGETPDQDDIKVDTSKQRLYFLEGAMSDDALGMDTHMNDEAVVLTDLNGCILH